MQHIVYYISGHGYGHAVRSIEVIKALSAQNPYLFFHIKTTAPYWFFPLNLNCNYTYYKQENDVGTVQHDFHEVDKSATLSEVTSMLATQDEFVEVESEFLKRAGASLVLGDIPPRAFAAARAAGLPSIAIGNFSWDWIYEPFLETHPGFSIVIDRISKAYESADLLLRLPMHGPMPCFRRTLDISLIARQAQRRRQDVRRMLKVPVGPDEDKIVVLVALRSADLRRVEFGRLAASKACSFIFLNQQNLAPGMLNLPQDLMPFQELVNAADVVVSKPGYGIVSECIANKTPLVYTQRLDFQEYDILVEALQKSTASRYVNPEDFFSGKWEQAIVEAASATWPSHRPALNGAQQAATCVQKALSEPEWLLDTQELEAGLTAE